MSLGHQNLLNIIMVSHFIRPIKIRHFVSLETKRLDILISYLVVCMRWEHNLDMQCCIVRSLLSL